METKQVLLEGLSNDPEGNCSIFWSCHWSKCAASWGDCFLRGQGSSWFERPKKLVSNSQLIIYGSFPLPVLVILSLTWGCWTMLSLNSLKKSLVISSQVIPTPAIFMPEKCKNQIFLKLKYSIYIFQWETLIFYCCCLTCFLLLGFNSVMGTHIVDYFIMKKIDHSYQNKLQFASYELLLSVMFTLWMKYIEKINIISEITR